jgi:2-polyprenyl-6-methoxyphenol hydroxylase-like FAD-dependent oxidoreductase
MRRSRIAVVGFGVAGATAAALLAEQGHDVTVFEQAPALEPVGAGVLLQPSGQAVLERLGALDEVAQGSEQIDRIVARTHRRRVILDLAYADGGSGLRGLGVARSTLHDALCALAGRTDVDVRVAAEIVSHDGGTLTDATGARHGPFELVVAADGSASQLRARSGLVRWSHEYAFGALWTVGQSSQVRGELRQVVRGTRDLLGLLPLGAGRCNFFFSQRHDRFAEVVARGYARWRDRVLALCPESEEVLTHVDGFEGLALTGYRHVILRRPYVAGLVLIGDAGHAMSPHLGQGVNLALIDAWTLAGCIAREQSLEHALPAYARARRAHLRFYAAVTMLLSPFFQSDGRVLGLARDTGLPLVQRVRPLRRLMARTMSGLTLSSSVASPGCRGIAP